MQLTEPREEQPWIIAVDFDGTIVEHEYPDIGQEVPDAVVVLRALAGQGNRLILWTMRSGARLDEAVAWCEERGLHFWAVNGNPEQVRWTESPKAYAHIYIDDAAMGCPVTSRRGCRRSFVDWRQVRRMLFDRDVFRRPAISRID